MKLLKEKIMSEGLVLNNAILKVDSFLNHQIDPELMMEIGKEFHRRFSGCGITKIFTIESSGIACALPAGLCMHVPVVFARKQKSALMSSEAYSTKVYSFTKKVTSDVTVPKKHRPAGRQRSSRYRHSYRKIIPTGASAPYRRRLPCRITGPCPGL